MSGGKNSEKRSTRIPTAFAAAKCPNSCRTTSAANPANASSAAVIGPAPPRPARPRRRAPRGRPRRATRTRGPAPPASCSSVRSMTSAMPVNARRPRQERVNGDLVGGVQRARRRAARFGGGPREPEARERLVVDRLERQRPTSRDRAPRGTSRARGRAAHRRSARACPAGRGARAPRRRAARRGRGRSTAGARRRRCPRSGTPKRWWASMTSRPLFMSVAESMEILPPMAHVGCASASSTVTDCSDARERPGTGRRTR